MVMLETVPAIENELCERLEYGVSGHPFSKNNSSLVFKLYGFQLGQFVSMYGDCFLVECISTCSNTILAWQSLTCSPP